MRRPPRPHFLGLFRPAIVIAILRLPLPFALARRLARPPTFRSPAIALMMAVARLRLKERFAMATFAPAFGVHASHHFRPARSRQTCHAFHPYSVHEGRKSTRPEEDVSSLNAEEHRPEEYRFSNRRFLDGFNSPLAHREGWRNSAALKPRSRRLHASSCGAGQFGDRCGVGGRDLLTPPVSLFDRAGCGVAHHAGSGQVQRRMSIGIFGISAAARMPRRGWWPEL